MNDHICFYLGLTCFMIHEMDAVRCKEWRIFPGLSLLDDHWGFRVFMLAHIPLFFFIFRGLTGQVDREIFIFWSDIFFIIHLGLHLIFLMHKRNEFKDRVSWVILSGTGFLGVLDLVQKISSETNG